MSRFLLATTSAALICAVTERHRFVVSTHIAVRGGGLFHLHPLPPHCCHPAFDRFILTSDHFRRRLPLSSHIARRRHHFFNRCLTLCLHVCNSPTFITKTCSWSTGSYNSSHFQS